MKKVDIGVMVAFVLSLVVIFFFWGCEYDPIVTALGGVIVLVSAVTTYLQYKKIDELEEVKIK